MMEDVEKLTVSIAYRHYEQNHQGRLEELVGGPFSFVSEEDGLSHLVYVIGEMSQRAVDEWSDDDPRNDPLMMLIEEQLMKIEDSRAQWASDNERPAVVDLAYVVVGHMRECCLYICRGWQGESDE